MYFLERKFYEKKKNFKEIIFAISETLLNKLSFLPKKTIDDFPT